MTDPAPISARATPVVEAAAPKDIGASPGESKPALPLPQPNSIDVFLEAIEPFFYGRPISYVDVGAHRGDVLQAIVAKGPRIGAALLIEPNPISFAVLEARTRALGLGRHVQCHNVALAAAPGRLRLKDADDMTQVLGPAEHPFPPVAGRVFEADAVTLDTLAGELRKPQINLLKIDVEGFEVEVLAGATNLLAEQAIDMIYIEAGMNPQGSQQTYYRAIEDSLGAHGYRLFRIFEQMHEWPDDSPLLRRTNLAFMSPRFAAAHPYRLCTSLMTARRENEALKGEQTTLKASLAALQTEGEAQARRHEDAARDLQTAREENETLRREHKRALAGLAALEREIATKDERHETAARELRSAREENETLKREQTTLKASLAALQTEGEAQARRHEDAARDLQTAREENETLRREHKRALAGLAALEREIATKDERHETAARELRSAREENETLKREQQAAHDRITGLQRELIEISRRHDAAAAETIALRKQLEAERGARDGAAAAELARERAELKKLQRYAHKIERRYAEVLSSESWRATAPVRAIIRMLKGDKKPIPFVPRIPAPNSAARAQQAAAASRSRALDPAGDRTARAKPSTDLSPKAAEIRRYVHHLWGGLSQPAVQALEAVVDDPSYPDDRRFEAAHHLATWYAFNDDFDAALQSILAIDAVAPKRSRAKQRLLKEGFIRLKRGEREAARTVFKRLLAQPANAHDPDAMLALANCLPDDEARLAQINRVFARAGHVELTRIRVDQPLALDNIRGMPAACAIADLGKVSVIMPAFASEGTLRTAVRSLQEQTYRNLEIIIVDDCSPDGTLSVADEMARSDDRVMVIRQERNGGAYEARNRGLAEASGDFITTHDADDWSHPQKIERQLAYLSAKPAVMGVCTHWVRATHDLKLTPNWRIGERIIHWSHSSFLFRREVTECLGIWDPVRVGADTEFILRAEAAYGKGSVQKIEKSVPLAFALDDDSSLTRTKHTHVRTVYFGLRQIYRAVAQRSHVRSGGNDREMAERRLAALPDLLTRRGDGPLELDLLLMGNCCDPKIVAEMAGLLDDPTAQRKRIGVFHWPDFNASPGLICADYADLLLDHGVIPVPPQTAVALPTNLGIFFGDCTVEPDALPVLRLKTSEVC